MLEYIDVGFEIKQISESEDDQYFMFEGMASTFGNVDKVDDVVMPGAFKESLTNNPLPKILWQHSANEPIGMPVELKETDNGLYVRGKLPKSDTFVSGRVIPQIKIGSINSMSIGYRVRENGSEIRSDGVRMLKSVDLREISLVSFPANEMATVIGYKSHNYQLKSVGKYQGSLPIATMNRIWDSTAAVARIRNFTGSNDKPSNSYRDNFLWYNSEKPELFGSYKFPYVDIINGKRTVIPRAINNAKSRLSQAVDISQNEKNGILSLIERYQSKFNKAFYGVDELKQLTTREFESILRESDLFSKQACVYIASKMDLGDLGYLTNENACEKSEQDEIYTKLMQTVNKYA